MLTDAEKEAAKKKVADEDARKAATGDSQDDDADDADGSDSEDDSSEKDLSWTKEQKAYVDSLRKESAKYRTKAKELESGLKNTNERMSKFENGLKKLFGEEDDKLTPEQRIEMLNQQNEQLAVATAIKDAAFELGVTRDDYEFFEYLVGKRLAALGDDEELTEEELASFAKQAKSKSAPKKTSVDDDAPDPDEDDGGVSLEEFQDMGIGARSALYQKDKALYEKLVAMEKKSKRK